VPPQAFESAMTTAQSRFARAGWVKSTTMDISVSDRRQEEEFFKP
jgi:hypothetical protein